MKNLITLLACASIVLSCETAPKDAVSLNGKISNASPNNELKVFNREGYEKVIPISPDGTFQDTLKVAAGTYMFQVGQEYGQMYLENGQQIHFDLDYSKFDETLTFKGDAADKNNFIIANTLLPEANLPKDIFSRSAEDFDASFVDLRKSFDSLKLAFPTLNSDFLADFDQQFEEMKTAYKNYHQSKLDLMAKLPKGTPSPLFTNYRNANGSQSSLTDFLGKYVYIDVWATWCGPCIAEIPALDELQDHYKDKNISFLSVSIDQEKDYQKWLDMIKEKNLGGNQVFADNAWQSEFAQAYLIDGIPRFILLDPQNKIVSADAPRPSDPTIRKMLDELL